MMRMATPGQDPMVKGENALDGRTLSSNLRQSQSQKSEDCSFQSAL